MDEIKRIKEDVLRFMQQEVSKYGNGRMDVKQVGELADVIKDLAEAEYYCAVAQAMGGQDQMGYTQPNVMGYQGQQGSMGGRSGYGGSPMGHSDPMQTVRELLADPEMRTMIRNEVMR